MFAKVNVGVLMVCILGILLVPLAYPSTFEGFRKPFRHRFSFLPIVRAQRGLE